MSMESSPSLQRIKPPGENNRSPFVLPEVSRKPRSRCWSRKPRCTLRGIKKGKLSSTSRTMRTPPSTNIEKSLKECRDKVPSEVVKGIESALTDLRNAMTKDNIDEIKAKLDAANKAVSKIGQHMPGGFGGGSSVLSC